MRFSEEVTFSLPRNGCSLVRDAATYTAAMVTMLPGGLVRMGSKQTQVCAVHVPDLAHCIHRRKEYSLSDDRGDDLEERQA